MKVLPWIKCFTSSAFQSHFVGYDFFLDRRFVNFYHMTKAGTEILSLYNIIDF